MLSTFRLLFAALLFALPSFASAAVPLPGLVSTPAMATAADPGSILHAVPLNANTVVYLQADGAMCIASVEDLLAGREGSTVTIDDTGAAAGPQHTYTTTYNSAHGAHTVTTPCGSTPLDRCAEQHKRAVEELQRVFPKIPA